MSDYKNKLKDPRWQKKRLEILERDEWCCQVCYDGESTLHVHHKLYEKDKDPWDYDNDYLITLCDVCHENETDDYHSINRYLIKQIRRHFLNKDIMKICNGIEDMKLCHTSEIIASVYSHAFSSEDIQRQLVNLFFYELKEKQRG